MPITISVDAPTADEVAAFAKISAGLSGTIEASGSIASGTTVTPAATAIDYFPANSLAAPAPSPENSTLSGVVASDGSVTIGGVGGDGTPLSGANTYLKDSETNTWTLLPELATATTVPGKTISYADLTRVVQFPITMNGTIVWSASKLIVRQGQVYLMDGQSWCLVVQSGAGGIRAGALPPAWVTTPIVGSGDSITTTTPHPPVPDLPPASPVIGGTSNTILTVGAGQTYATINAALSAAKPGDRVVVEPGTYKESIGITKAVLLKSSVPAVLPPVIAGTKPTLNSAAHAIIDVSAIPSASTFEQKGAVIPKVDGAIIDGFEIVGAGMDQTVSSMTSGVRIDGPGNYTLRNLYVHGCQEGLAASMSLAATATIENCYVADCGIADGLSHNLYIGDVPQLTINGLVSTMPTYAHALKSRAWRMSVTGFWGDAANASIIDVPQGTGTQGAIANFVLTKNTGDANHAVISYCEESQSNGAAGLAFSQGTITADCTNPFMQFSAGTVAFDSTVTFQPSGVKIAVQGGGATTGLPT